ncbi:hypothetical protein GSbR_29150 [Geobacter sp. SVR]|nr:hypothetical protein GSVR_22140 [Geobacter sp. SVR]GCF86315.1 hypothetical protein GSbR_29150 [Geobacter sp. SVR]
MSEFPCNEIPGLSRRGRRRQPDSKRSSGIALRPDQWAYLELWFPGGKPTAQVESLLDRAMLFWPAGPNAFGHATKKGSAK